MHQKHQGPFHLQGLWREKGVLRGVQAATLQQTLELNVHVQISSKNKKDRKKHSRTHLRVPLVHLLFLRTYCPGVVLVGMVQVLEMTAVKV